MKWIAKGLARPLLVIACVALLFSCRKEAVDYRCFPVNSVFKGTVDDGRTLFLVRDADSLRVSGYAFLYDGEPLVDQIPFVADSTGRFRFYSEGDSILNELSVRSSDRKLVLLFPRSGCRLLKRKVHLEYFYALDADSRYVMPYKQEVCDSIVSHLHVEYGTAMGYYSSQPTDTIATGKMDQVRKLIVKDLARSIARRTEIPLHMDIYEPAVDHHGLKRPLVLFMHGGAFLFGDKQNSLQRAVTESLVRKGYVVASVNYRLGISFGGLFSIERTIYRGVKDVRAAMHYLIEHADDYKIDVNQIYLSGSSAGAIIALTTTFMDGDEVFESVEKRIERSDLGPLRMSSNSDDEKFNIAGVVSLWGGLIDLDIINERDGDIPVLLFHGTADNIVPYESGLPFQEEFDSKFYDKLSDSWRLYGSAAIHRHMQEQHMPVECVSFPGYGHEPQENEDGTLNENMDRILESTSSFLYAQVSDYFVPCTIKTLDGELAARYKLEGDCRALHWWADGGIVVDKSDKEVCVAWLNGAEQRKVHAVVSTEEGVCFEKGLMIQQSKRVDE